MWDSFCIFSTTKNGFIERSVGSILIRAFRLVPICLPGQTWIAHT